MSAPIENEGFLNVDLEIRSRRKLDLLAAQLESRTIVLHCGRVGKDNFLSLESGKCLLRDPEKLMADLCSSIEQLSGEPLRLWKSAHRRTFDIGLETPRETTRALNLRLSQKILDRLVKLGAEIAITVYRR